ncbi:MAG: isoprenylcysteine carboxylmethyltransferase family protein [Gemmatimonadales bacterium]
MLAAVGAAFVTALSWRSLRQPSSHGFFRFFAFLAILCLIALNLPRWFERPWSLPQLASWTLLVASLFPAVLGFRLLRRRGRPTRPDPGSPLMGFENTSALVTSGIYRFIRHPLYASLVYLTWGVALKSVSWLTAGLAVVATGFLVATAKAEEVENLSRFGAAYGEYMARTRLFVPFIL